MAETESILIDPIVAGAEEEQIAPSEALVGWLMSFLPQWRNTRDNAYKDKWDDYYNTWRGKWTPASKDRKKQRSRLISPATQMAVDLMVAEIIEAVLGRDQFIDLPDDALDEDKADMERVREELMEDLYGDGFISFLTEMVLNGALYGTGIAKINIDVTKEIGAAVVNQEMVKRERERVRIFPTPVEPGQLIVDPSTNKIDDMMGVAVEFKMPLHKVWERQRDGTYRDDVMVGEGVFERGTNERKEEDNSDKGTWASIIEYHGKVPKVLLMRANTDDPDDVILEGLMAGIPSSEMVEAVVTVANESDLLRAIPNPSIMNDRGVLAYQHDTVPNRFWGRGVVEKAMHPQKALDAEMRSRADSLAWVNNPMIAYDLTKVPPRSNFDVWPGKAWGLKGPVDKGINEFRFGDINASTFQQTNDLERMVADATGARDPATIQTGVRDQATGASAIGVSGLIKRSKRTMYNIEEFLQQLIRRIVWRKMQFEPTRYPNDVRFKVKATMGIMAREVEQQFLMQALQFTEQGSLEHIMVLNSIFENSSIRNKSQVTEALQKKLAPPSEEEQQQEQQKQQMLEQLQVQTPMAELQKIRAQTALLLAQGDKAKADTLLKQIEAEFKDDEIIMANMRLVLDQKEVDNQAKQIEVSERKLGIDAIRVAKQGSK